MKNIKETLKKDFENALGLLRINEFNLIRFYNENKSKNKGILFDWKMSMLYLEDLIKGIDE